MAFLLDNPNRVKQYGYPRRGGGFTAPQITLHTYEAPHTRSLLAAATYLLQRTDHGSYHALAGARSPQDVLQLAPWSYETWHSSPSNNWAIGISAVTYAHQWNALPRTSRDNLVESMSYSAAQAAKWLRDAHGRHVTPRFLTRAQAMRKEAGFVMHATVDPDRRSDAGADFPREQFLAAFNRHMSDTGKTPTPAPAAKPAAPAAKPAAPAAKPAPVKSTTALAREVIDGRHGSGDARRRALGSRYAAVQAEVNRLLAGTPAKSNAQVAREVLAGAWGNNPERAARLRAAGYDPDTIQTLVNRLT